MFKIEEIQYVMSSLYSADENACTIEGRKYAIETEDGARVLYIGNFKFCTPSVSLIKNHDKHYIPPCVRYAIQEYASERDVLFIFQNFTSQIRHSIDDRDFFLDLHRDRNENQTIEAQTTYGSNRLSVSLSGINNNEDDDSLPNHNPYPNIPEPYIEMWNSREMSRDQTSRRYSVIITQAVPPKPTKMPPSKYRILNRHKYIRFVKSDRFILITPEFYENELEYLKQHGSAGAVRSWERGYNYFKPLFDAATNDPEEYLYNHDIKKTDVFPMPKSPKTIEIKSKRAEIIEKKKKEYLKSQNDSNIDNLEFEIPPPMNDLEQKQFLNGFENLSPAKVDDFEIPKQVDASNISNFLNIPNSTDHPESAETIPQKPKSTEIISQTPSKSSDRSSLCHALLNDDTGDSFEDENELMDIPEQDNEQNPSADEEEEDSFPKNRPSCTPIPAGLNISLGVSPIEIKQKNETKIELGEYMHQCDMKSDDRNFLASPFPRILDFIGNSKIENRFLKEIEHPTIQIQQSSQKGEEDNKMQQIENEMPQEPEDEQDFGGNTFMSDYEPKKKRSKIMSFLCSEEDISNEDDEENNSPKPEPQQQLKKPEEQISEDFSHISIPQVENPQFQQNGPENSQKEDKIDKIDENSQKEDKKDEIDENSQKEDKNDKNDENSQKEDKNDEIDENSQKEGNNDKIDESPKKEDEIEDIGSEKAPRRKRNYNNISEEIEEEEEENKKPLQTTKKRRISQEKSPEIEMKIKIEEEKPNSGDISEDSLLGDFDKQSFGEEEEEEEEKEDPEDEEYENDSNSTTPPKKEIKTKKIDQNSLSLSEDDSKSKEEQISSSSLNSLLGGSKEDDDDDAAKDDDDEYEEKANKKLQNKKHQTRYSLSGDQTRKSLSETVVTRSRRRRSLQDKKQDEVKQEKQEQEEQEQEEEEQKIEPEEEIEEEIEPKEEIEPEEEDFEPEEEEEEEEEMTSPKKSALRQSTLHKSINYDDYPENRDQRQEGVTSPRKSALRLSTSTKKINYCEIGILEKKRKKKGKGKKKK